MEIVVAGRHTEVTPRYRAHLENKLAKIEQLAPRAQRVDVIVSHEPNPRQSDSSERVEITVVDKGPVIRAEACSDDAYAALDLALGRLIERLRRARDRRKAHRNHGQAAPGDAMPLEPEDLPDEPAPAPQRDEDGVLETTLGDSPVVIREKVHHAQPMTLDDALYEMEMVGHDFYLFVDAETAQPAVAYRRRGWSYGVIKLDAPVRDVGPAADQVAG
ncbi:ribosome hibernation-promoting factor, HPF/YfiA family [Cellulomonas shaoxiangyii]|uniref:Ribosome hibernation promoting factor n=1 Tax=Cellulomonas shaoxiangyii TaxID=2566013 RepID=A0A4P7SHP9_9CELL|nr:ribosome-associated translation inhibitor RaiA [Cellulomonas shaoxiangyii]QCB93168.1 ribosome-associated translation inhibitor RaiA [Cellulomonas shaoxiangyii]TGY77804.1 ribosome-associated translation inhibitor RaiA [Cellulomonas shaoxiangyii]